MTAKKDYEELAKNDPVEYVKMLVSTMFRKSMSQEDFEDAIGDGLVGLVDAQKRFKPDLGNKFITYAEYRVKGEIIDSIRRRRGRNGQKDFLDEMPEFLEIDQTESVDSPLENILIIEEKLNTLSERERTIVVMRAEGYTLKEVAKEINLSACRVQQLEGELGDIMKKDPIVVARQAKVFPLYKGNKPPKEIASELGLRESIVRNDIAYFKKQEVRKEKVEKVALKAKVEFMTRTDYRDTVSHILRDNKVSVEKINIIMNIINLR